MMLTKHQTLLRLLHLVQMRTSEVLALLSLLIQKTRLTYTTNSAGFAINAASGALTFTSEPDYETKNSYDLTVQVTDGEFEVEQTINVAVNNLNDNAQSF